MVEIYQNTELNDICFDIDNLKEWEQLNKELGLSMQLDFTKHAESPIPYPFINKSMELIFTTLCPCKIEVEKYNKTPIPLEVLKQLSYSKKENHCNKYEIWYDDKSPDPFLVGVLCKFFVNYKFEGNMLSAKNDKQEYIYVNNEEEAKNWCKDNGKELYNITPSSWGENYKTYLIARWADVIRPIAELKELAKERLIETYGATLKNEITQKQAALSKLKENVTLFLSGEISKGQLEGDRW